MRLIDADKLIEVLNEKSVPFNANVNDAILTAPTIDAVDLIRREDAIEAVEKAKTARSADGEIFCAKINAQMNIQHLPSVQPKIIRCKDCK